MTSASVGIVMVMPYVDGAGVDCVSESLCKSFEGDPSYGNY